MKTLFRKLVTGFIVGIGLTLGVVTVAGIQAATIPNFTGPMQPPTVQAYLNQLINSINTTLAPGGTNTMASFLAIKGSSVGQIVSPASWLNVTTTCPTTNANECLIIQDTTGTVRRIPAY